MRWSVRVVGLLGAALVIAGVVALSLSPVLLAQDKAKDKAPKDKAKDKGKDKGKAVPLIVRQREIRRALYEARKSREALLAASLGTMKRPVFGGHDKKALKSLDETIKELAEADKAVTVMVDKYYVPPVADRLRGIRHATAELRQVRKQVAALKPGYYAGNRAKATKHIDKGLAELVKADKFLVGKLGKDKDKAKPAPKDKPGPKEAAGVAGRGGPKLDTNPVSGVRKALLALRHCKSDLEGITRVKRTLFGGFRGTALEAIDRALKDLVEAEKVAVKRVEEGD